MANYAQWDGSECEVGSGGGTHKNPLYGSRLAWRKPSLRPPLFAVLTKNQIFHPILPHSFPFCSMRFQIRFPLFHPLLAPLPIRPLLSCFVPKETRCSEWRREEERPPPKILFLISILHEFTHPFSSIFLPHKYPHGT